MSLRIVSGAHANTGAAVCLHDTCTVPLENFDRVPRARTRVHARVSVNNSVILSTWIKQRF